MKLNEKFNVFDVTVQKQIDIINNRSKNHRKAADALVFAIFDTKTHYNNHYKIIKIKPNDKTYIKLHKRYHLFKLKNIKLFN